MFSQQPEKDVWLRAEPRVTDTEIAVPIQPYYQKGTAVTYRTVITREVFVEAYRKWILGDKDDKDKQRVEDGTS